MKKADVILSQLDKEYESLAKIQKFANQSEPTYFRSGNTDNTNGNTYGYDSGDKTPHVTIRVNRFKYGATTTLSNFEACAYGPEGDKISSISGYFLEPVFDEDRNKLSGSDTAIPGGTYQVGPSTYHGNSGYFEVAGVSGRSAIKIHPGNYGTDTEGCLMPGTAWSYNELTGDYQISQSKAKFNELKNFLNQYSSGIATIIITP